MAQGAAPVIGEVVVTAQKRAENVQDVPISVVAVSGDALQRMNVNNVQQLVKIDPSVKYRTSTSASTSAFVVRGIGTSSFSTGIEQSISTVVDGVVLGEPSAVSTLTDVDRVEILRGPQGMLFGKNASAGLVNITTKRPNVDSSELTLHGEVGQNGHHIAQAIYNLPVSEEFALRFVAHLNQRDGIVSNENPLADSEVDGQDVYGGVIKALWRPTDDLEIYASIDGARSDAFCCSQVWRVNRAGYAPAVIYDRYAISPGPDNTRGATNFSPYGEMFRAGGSIEVNYDLGGYTVTSISAYRNFKASSFYDGDQTTVSYIDLNGGTRSLNQFSQELRLTSPPSERFDYVAGLYYFESSIRQVISQEGQLTWILPASNGQVIRTVPSQPAGTLFGVDTSNDVRSKSSAAFAQFNFYPIPDLKLIAGARLTHDELDLRYRREARPGALLLPGAVTVALTQQLEETNVSWRLGAQYDFSPDVMAYATVSRGYKGPGFSGLTVTSPTADQSVRPEIPTNYELGLRSTLMDHRVLVNATIFRTDFKDFQAQVADLSSPTYATRITNAGNLRTQGVELTLGYRPTEELTLSGGATWLDAKYRDFPGVQCYFGQPKVAQGGLCTAPPSSPNSADGVFNAAGHQL
ncbi:MAG: TonB-dependent receptor, partial [Sphingomonadaceae bacterium]